MTNAKTLKTFGECAAFLKSVPPSHSFWTSRGYAASVAGELRMLEDLLARGEIKLEQQMRTTVTIISIDERDERITVGYDHHPT
jgi:hypothetical protein